MAVNSTLHRNLKHQLPERKSLTPAILSGAGGVRGCSIFPSSCIFWHLIYDILRAVESRSGLEQMFIFPRIMFLTVTKTRCLEKTVAIEEA